VRDSTDAHPESHRLGVERYVLSHCDCTHHAMSAGPPHTDGGLRRARTDDNHSCGISLGIASRFRRADAVQGEVSTWACAAMIRVTRDTSRTADQAGSESKMGAPEQLSRRSRPVVG